MKVIECTQGTEEWFEARTGKVTGSVIADAIAMLKRGNGETQGRKDLKAILAAERIGGEMLRSSFVSNAMQWGVETEPRARGAYEMRNGLLVDTVGFVCHPSIEWAGCSPDGLVGTDGAIEIKCPNSSTHIEYLLANRVPPEYEPQVMWTLACTEREWLDFISFDDRLISRLQMFTFRVFRDEQRIADLENGVRRFLLKVDELIAELERLNPEQAPAEKLREQMDASLGLTDDDAPAWWFDDNAPEHAVKL